MIRHIFIGTFKEGVSEAKKKSILKDMQKMQDEIPGIVQQDIGFSTGWAGPENQVVITVDFKDKEDFDVYMRHPYHMDYIDKLGTEFFDRSSFVSAQFVFDE